MTDLNELDLLLEEQDMAEATLAGAVTERKCRRHMYTGNRFGPDDTTPYEIYCVRCLKVFDPVRSRRGKSSRRLGSDQERRAERVYGFQKVGEFGGITDLQGRTAKVQMKASRASAPVKWKRIFAGLDEVADGRMPAILFSFIRQGLQAEDYFVVRGKDWLDWRGRDDSEGPE